MSLGDRLGRLLFIVPYVAARDGVPLRELAESLGVSSRQIESDIELLSMVGQPPLTPDHLIDLYVEDDVVYVDLHQSLTRPLRLTHDEAGGLVLGAKLVGRLGGLGDELEVAIEKLMRLLNPVERETVQSMSEHIGLGHDTDGRVVDPAGDLRAAIAAQHEVRVEYYSASSDRNKAYTLKPLAVVAHGGGEYLVALDTAADDHEKLFRLDRMGSVTDAGRRFVPPESFDLEKFRTRRLYFGRDGFAAHVHFKASRATIVRETFETKDIEEHGDGSLTVQVSTSSPAWLSRWVLAFGEEAEVRGPQQQIAYIGNLCAEAAAAYAQPVPAVLA